MPVKERTMTELKTFFLLFLKYSAHASQICVDIWIITGFFYQLYGPSSCPDSQMSIYINDSHPQDKRAYSKNAIDRMIQYMNYFNDIIFMVFKLLQSHFSKNRFTIYYLKIWQNISDSTMNSLLRKT